MVHVKLKAPDGVMSLVKYAMAENKMTQNDVLVTLIQIAEAAIPFAELAGTIKTVHEQTQAKIALDQKISDGKEGV